MKLQANFLLTLSLGAASLSLSACGSSYHSARNSAKAIACAPTAVSYEACGQRHAHQRHAHHGASIQKSRYGSPAVQYGMAYYPVLRPAIVQQPTVIAPLPQTPAQPMIEFYETPIVSDPIPYVEAAPTPIIEAAPPPISSWTPEWTQEPQIYEPQSYESWSTEPDCPPGMIKSYGNNDCLPLAIPRK